MKRKRFYVKPKAPFSKIVLIAQYKNKNEAEKAAALLRKEGIPAEMNTTPAGTAEDGNLVEESYTLWVWHEAKKDALKILTGMTS